jgi:hypothetical protein
MCNYFGLLTSDVQAGCCFDFILSVEIFYTVKGKFQYIPMRLAKICISCIGLVVLIFLKIFSLIA